MRRGHSHWQSESESSTGDCVWCKDSCRIADSGRGFRVFCAPLTQDLPVSLASEIGQGQALETRDRIPSSSTDKNPEYCMCMRNVELRRAG